MPASAAERGDLTWRRTSFWTDSDSVMVWLLYPFLESWVNASGGKPTISIVVDATAIFFSAWKCCSRSRCSLTLDLAAFLGIDHKAQG